jgi:7-cyano-7-deazaguanine synthase in queuosine biosynthesis
LNAYSRQHLVLWPVATISTLFNRALKFARHLATAWTLYQGRADLNRPCNRCAARTVAFAEYQTPAAI